MPNTPADTLVPLSVVAICAAALVAVAQLGPDHIPRIGEGRGEEPASKVAKSSRPADTKPPAPTMPKIDWRPQPAGDQPLTRIGFGSCQRQRQPIPIWASVIEAKPETFLMLGDNVYGDFNDAAGSKLIKAYSQLAAHADFSKAASRLPMLATWDDHDFGRNDGGADFEHKATSAKLFQQFWAGSGTLNGARGPGIAYARAFGPRGRRTQIIMLDARSFRSPLKREPGKRAYQPDAAPAKTVLGQEQWSWLEAQLKEPADLRLIVSGIQVLAEGHTWERWGNLPKERERLLGLVDTAKGRTVLLSGDRHRAAIYSMSRATGRPILEVTSSSLNKGYPDPNEQGPYQLGEMYGDSNFGMISIDWEARLATLTLRGADGVAVRGQVVWLGPSE